MHMATHFEVDDNQLPYFCDICKKRFATSQLLVTHQFRHQTKSFSNNIKLESAITVKNDVNITYYINYIAFVHFLNSDHNNQYNNFMIHFFSTINAFSGNRIAPMFFSYNPSKNS